MPSAAQDTHYVYSVVALATNDVWAIGYYWAYDETWPLFEHWNGANWTIVPSQNRAGRYSEIHSAGARATNDIWAVGYMSGDRTVIEHWDGANWTVVPSPNGPTGSSVLSGVAAVAANDAWAVGHNTDPATGHLTTLVEHWNGSAWTVVPSPNVGSLDSALYDIAVVSATDIWASGDAAGYTLLEHWDGTIWAL